MAKQKIVTLDDYDYLDYRSMEHPSGESKTVPGEAMTVREIYDRYVRGQDVREEDLRRGMYYDDDQDFDSPDLESLARGWSIENQEYLQELKMDIELKREKLNAFLKKVQDEKLAPVGDASASPGSASPDSGDSQGKKPAKPAKEKGAPGGAKRSESDD